eukprot:c20742_g1_i2.p1 GENE.c20742_g1_i2~~c20742_g1_i2.p1  ORF type:complete len:102 (+),score=3.73 c20742_g1_i2:327-632(+)
MHKNDIVHRDIKPENIVFDRPGDDAALKLTDFWFAEIFQSKRKTLRHMRHPRNGCSGERAFWGAGINKTKQGKKMQCAALWSFGAVSWRALQIRTSRRDVT